MRPGRVGILALVAALAAGPAWAFHTVFDFTVDRVSLDGNPIGVADGVPDFTDDFNGGGYWYTPYGTSSVSGGRLHVKSPGVHFPGPDGLALDFSEVASDYPFRPVKGSGNFTATAVFDPIIPPEEHFYHFTLFTYGGGQYFNELFGVDIHTVGGVTRIEQHLVVLDLGHGIYQTVQAEGQDVTPAEITGQLHFRLNYDDTAGTISSSFSLDGGATFQSPFGAVPIFTEGRTSGQLILGADPRVDPNATTTTTTPGATTTTTTLPLGSCLRTDCATALQNQLLAKVTQRGSTVRWSWGFLQNGSVDPADAGHPPGTAYAVCLRDGAGTTLYHADLPLGAVGWKPAPGGYRFASKPLGIRVGYYGRPLHRAASVSAKGAILAQPLPLTTPLTFQVENDDGTCWSSTFDTPDVLRNDARLFKAVQR